MRYFHNRNSGLSSLVFHEDRFCLLDAAPSVHCTLCENCSTLIFMFGDDNNNVDTIDQNDSDTCINPQNMEFIASCRL